jgi:prepilin-type N-terminal cleavage/methylation domain-containing protein
MTTAMGPGRNPDECRETWRRVRGRTSALAARRRCTARPDAAGGVTPISARQARSRGFTLIEVAAALAIAAGSLLALLQIFTDSGRRADRATEARLAVLTAESVLTAAAAGVPGPLADGARWYGVTPTGQGWQVVVSEWPAGGRAAPEPLLIVATVRSAGGDGPVLAELATLRLAPAAVSPAERRRAR